MGIDPRTLGPEAQCQIALKVRRIEKAEMEALLKYDREEREREAVREARERGERAVREAARYLGIRPERMVELAAADRRKRICLEREMKK